MSAKETIEVIRGVLDIPTVRVVIRAAVVLGCLYAYYNHLDKRDIYTMLTFVFADVGLQAATAKKEA